MTRIPSSLNQRFCAATAVRLALCLLASGWYAANGAGLLVRGGTLIGDTGNASVANARILTTDGMIAGVWSGDAGAPNLPEGTQVVDAAGKFIIPGLIDSHVHYNWYAGELFLTYGVTSVNDLGGGYAWSTVETKFVAEGELSARLTAKETAHAGNYLVGVEPANPGGGTTEGLGFVVDYK